jgi:hypothetical protein
VEVRWVELGWVYIKDNVLKNKVFNTLLELELAVCKFVRNLSVDVVGGICGYFIE